MEEFSDVRFKQRAVIEFLIEEKVPPIEIHRRMQAVYGDQCVDMSIVRRWVYMLCVVSKIKQRFKFLAVEKVKSAVRKWFQKRNTNF